MVTHCCATRPVDCVRADLGMRKRDAPPEIAVSTDAAGVATLQPKNPSHIVYCLGSAGYHSHLATCAGHQVQQAAASKEVNVALIKRRNEL